jgi:hypothetical protein
MQDGKDRKRALENELMSAYAKAECNPTDEEYRQAWDTIERVKAEIATLAL